MLLCASPSFLFGQYIRFQSPLVDSLLFSDTIEKASSSSLLHLDEVISIRARNQALESSMSILAKYDSAKKNTRVSIDISKFKDSSWDLHKMITDNEDFTNFSLNLVEMLGSWKTLWETKHLEIKKSAFSGKHSNMAIDLGHFSVINSCTGGQNIQQQLSNASKEQVQEEENIFGAFCLAEPSQNGENRNSSIIMGLRSPSLFASTRNLNSLNHSHTKPITRPIKMPEKKTKNKGIFKAIFIPKKDDKFSGIKYRVTLPLFANDSKKSNVAKHIKNRVRIKRILIKLFR